MQGQAIPWGGILATETAQDRDGEHTAPVIVDVSLYHWRGDTDKNWAKSSLCHDVFICINELLF